MSGPGSASRVLNAPRPENTRCLHCRINGAIAQWQNDAGLDGTPLDELMKALANVVADVAMAGIADPPVVIGAFAEQYHRRLSVARPAGAPPGATLN